MTPELTYTCISTRRPHAVDDMHNHVQPKDLCWMVRDQKDYRDYKAAGAVHIEVSGGLCESRNAGIDHAHEQNRWCVQLSDDLKKVELAISKKKTVEIELSAVVEQIVVAMVATGARLGGVAPTANPFYFNPNRPLQQRHFIVGDLIVVAPTDLRFDENLKLKEDYDYTLQHISTYGKVARLSIVLAHFRHRNNSGGAVDFRTEDREQEAIAYLKEKWGSAIRDNPRRPNEILLYVK